MAASVTVRQAAILYMVEIESRDFWFFLFQSMGLYMENLISIRVPQIAVPPPPQIPHLGSIGKFGIFY